MKCRKPFLKNGQAFGCGQCLPCRIKIRREKSTRIILESCLYKHSSFVTLTYADAPVDGLSLVDYQRFLKRLRNALRPIKIRFYGVGEYGSEHNRPHYHFILFGLPAGELLNNIILEQWGKGHVDVKDFNPARARYIAGYVIDKLTNPFDERLCGLNPEFSTSSLNPGLGAGMVEHIAATFTRYNLLSADGGVPATIAIGGKPVPLGRYLRNLVRLHLSGRLDDYQSLPASAVLRRSRILREVAEAILHPVNEKRKEEMSNVYSLARSDPFDPSPLSHLLRISQQEIRNAESRFKNFSKRKKQL